MKKWRTAKMCSDCPFAKSGPGAHLRRMLRPSRWREILRDLKMDKYFLCHQTTEETGNGTNLECAGAIAWQEKYNRQPSQHARIMEWMYATRNWRRR